MLFITLIQNARSETSDQYPISDHSDGKFFLNPNGTDKGFSDVLKWWWSREKAVWPDQIPVVQQKYQETKRDFITFIGHSTFLLQIHETKILTDPIFSQRASPVSFAGPKRVTAPGMSLDDLPKIDIILLSHNHYDHMDIDTLKVLKQKFNPLIITGLGNKWILHNHDIDNVIELDWWQEYKFLDFKIIFTPAQHFSARTPFDRNETLWGSFVVQNKGDNYFFAGDTGYADHFKKINKLFGPMKLSLLPIGAYEPRWFMKTHHLNPEDAVLAHLELKSRYTLGMHFGTFQLTDEAVDQPLVDLKRAKEKLRISETSFETLDFGATKYLDTL